MRRKKESKKKKKKLVLTLASNEEGQGDDAETGREAAGCSDSISVLSGGKGEKDSDSVVAALRMSDAPTGSEGMCLTETSKNNCANESPAHLRGSN